MPAWAIKLIDASAAALVALLAPLTTILGSTTLLVVCDLVTGLIKAKKQGESISSHGLKKTVVKLLAYLSVIIMSHITELHLTGGAIPVLNVVTSIIGITELKSCVENINTISGGSVLNAVMRAISKHVPPSKK